MIAVTLLAVSSANSAEIPPISQFRRSAATLHLVERSDSFKDGSYAIWRGRITLTGKVTVLFERDVPEGSKPDSEGAVFFEPDEGSRKKLPEAIGSFYPLSATMIWLNESGAVALERVVGLTTARSYVKGAAGRYEFPAKVTIRTFRTDVECDHRSYSADVVTIQKTAPTLLALAESGEHGC